MVPVGLLVSKLSGILPSMLGLRYGGRLQVEITDGRLRQRQKLELVKAEIGIDVDILVADSQEQTAIDSIVSQTRVLLNTAGPFALYGDAIVDACVRYRTHYVGLAE